LLEALVLVGSRKRFEHDLIIKFVPVQTMVGCLECHHQARLQQTTIQQNNSSTNQYSADYFSTNQYSTDSFSSNQYLTDYSSSN